MYLLFLLLKMLNIRGSSWLPSFIILSAGVFWTLWAGKDMGWDLYNHHLYLPFSFLSGRYDVDIYAAGPQSYQNPLGYLPFYWMSVIADMPAWLVGVILAIVHGLAVIFAYRLALRVWVDDKYRELWAALAAAMAWISPAFLVVAGTSSTDPLTAVLVLWALLIVMGPKANLSHRAAFLAGLLLGCAFALKQSNAVFALSVSALVVWRALMGQDRPQAVLSLVAGGVLATTLMMGWWSWILWKEFSNPIYPLYNNLFHSPYASQDPMLAMRFMAHRPFDYVSRIWELAWFKQFVSMESALPDARPVLLVGFAAVLALCSVFRIALGGARYKDTKLRLWLVSADAQLMIFCLLSYVLWMKTSGNARYAIPLFLMVGLMLVRVAWALLPVKVARSFILLVLILQFGHFAASANVRLVPAEWDAGPYFDVAIPDKLIEKPFLHVSVGLQSYASLAPFMNAAGAMMNPIGQISLPTSGPLGERVLKLLGDWEGRTRILFPNFNATDTDRREAVYALMDHMLYRLGLAVDWSDCVPIRGLMVNILSCGAMSSTIDHSFESQRLVVDDVFEKVEALCPIIFGPRLGVSERGVGKWQRFYANTDAVVTVSLVDNVVFVSHGRSSVDQVIGSIDAVRAGAGQFNCRMWSLLAPD